MLKFILWIKKNVIYLKGIFEDGVVMPLRKKKKFGKKKTLAVVTSPSKHLLKEQALRYLVDKRMKITQVARLLNTSPAMIKSFFEDENFLYELQERIDSITSIDTEYRIEQAKISLNHFYEELRKREVIEEMDVSTSELHKMIINTQKELRLDTPDGFTSKVGVADLSKLQDRFDKSLSGRLHRMKKVSKKKKEGDVSGRKTGHNRVRKANRA